MAAVRSLAAVLLIVVASVLAAQNASTGKVVITVFDESGAVIPGAHIGIICLPNAASNDSDWLHYVHNASEQTWTHTDASGEATVGLAKGNYAIAISAQGFQPQFESVEVRDEPSQSLRTMLRLGGCTECVTVESAIPIPVEYSYPHIVIPLEPLQTMTPPAVRVRRRWWF